MNQSTGTTEITSLAESAEPIGDLTPGGMTSVADAPPDRLERWSERLNPILVKEVRQSVKSRVFISTFSLLLLGAWLVSVFYLLAAGASIEYGSGGNTLFSMYLMVLCVAVFVIVPFTAFRSLLTERDENTYELLSITTLTPGQIVRGKWSCALVQAGLFYSAIAPFIAFTALLAGFDFAQAVYWLFWIFYSSMTLSVAALMLSTTVTTRAWQGILSMIVLVGLGILLLSSLSGIGASTAFPLPLDEPDFWWANAIALAISASYQWLFYQIAAARLTFETENRSTGIRITASIQFWLIWLAAAGAHLYYAETPDAEFIQFMVIVSGIHWAILGIAFCGETDGLSRRIARSLPTHRVRRLISIPWMPGGTRGYLYLLLHVAALFLLAEAARLWGLLGVSGSIDRWDDTYTLSIAVCCYLVIYPGLIVAFHRWGSRAARSFTGVHARVAALVLLAAGALAPMAVRFARSGNRWNDVSVFDILFPFWYIAEILDRNSDELQLLSLVIIAVAVFAMNLRALLKRTMLPPRLAPAPISGSIDARSTDATSTPGLDLRNEVPGILTDAQSPAVSART